MATDRGTSGSAGRSRTVWWIVGCAGLVVAVAAGWMAWWHRGGGAVAEGGRGVGSGNEVGGGGTSAVVVRVTAAEQRTFVRRLRLQGTLEAETFANVSPRIPGTIERIAVDEGDAVQAGRTVLFEIDRVKLEKAVRLGQADVTVAACGLRQAQANLEKVRADFHKAELDLRRFERLYEEGAVTADALEQQQSRHAQLQAMITLAEADVELAAERHRQAQTALEIAEKDLADAVVTAPIDGVVSQRFQEPGEMGSPGMPVVRIEDISVVKASAFLPGEYYGQVEPGRTPVRLTVAGRDAGQWVVDYRSPTIDPQLRTFEIEARVDRPGPGVVPGALAQIEVMLEQRQGVGVPRVAIEQRGGRDVVFVVRDGRAVEVAIRRGIEDDSWVEVAEGDVAAGEPVVTMGQTFVEDGAAVEVQSRPGAVSSEPVEQDRPGRKDDRALQVEGR